MSEDKDGIGASDLIYNLHEALIHFHHEENNFLPANNFRGYECYIPAIIRSYEF